ncbi:MAG TPA: hypothetical protein VFQ00_09710 [Terriglobales bacterium]|nr:hypothetical protein [Terriglobales bacterium]
MTLRHLDQLHFRQGLLVCLTFFLISPIALFAGPPFQTDDPEPVPFGHFEAYLFELSDGTRAGGTVCEVPSFEMNWGAVPNVQLHVVIPAPISFAPNNGPVNYGIGDTELGVKYRFVKETPVRPEIGIFPFVELPTGDSSRGLGVGTTWYRLPIWAQKSWGPWTSYGGGGRVIAHAPGLRDFNFFGLLVQRQITKRLTLGNEIFGHGAEGPAATSMRSSTMDDVGGFFNFTPGFQLLFAAGHSFVGQGETYTYLALYWTWGKDKGQSSDAGSTLMGRVHVPQPGSFSDGI